MWINNCSKARALIVFSTLISVSGAAFGKDNHQTQGRRAWSALRHQLDILHQAEANLLGKRAEIEKDIEKIHLQIVETQRALRSIEATIKH